MPSRKQRRRREKLKRHEYEYVVETEEGEVPLERLRDLDDAQQADRKRNDGAPGGLVDRRGQPIQKPSLRRVLRRALIFTPFLFLFVYVIGGDELTVAQKIAQTAFLLVLFIPFSYLVDQFVYRMLVRRAERERGAGRAR
ncbi:MAG TPA: hypothetical protein VHF67_02740 [Gaiellaceae bacterium]|nr:hypothetical protein [Gaiellaceae bacterium]